MGYEAPPFTTTETPARKTIRATPFTWRDPASFPRRQWLYGHHLIRKFLSCTVAPGGLGKTSLVLVEAVAMAAGRALIGAQPRDGKLKVWVVNLEDPREEIERRVIAICLHFDVDPDELDGHLFLDSGREVSMVVATTGRNGTEIATPVVDEVRAEINAREIDVLIVDPFVKSHRVQENDNGAIDAVATAFAGIADATSCAIELVHHVRKGHGGEITVEDGRGAVALLSAVRSARVLNPMSKEEAEKAGGVIAREHFRVTNGKANLAPPPDKSEWFRLLSVPLGNGRADDPFDFNQDGDKVAVVESWSWPDLTDGVQVKHLLEVQTIVSKGRYRENVQAGDWVGKVVAKVLNLDAANNAHRAQIKAALAMWLASGALTKVSGLDKNREERTFIEVGEWAT